MLSCHLFTSQHCSAVLMPMHWKCFPNKAMVLPPLMPHRYEMCSCLQLTYYRMDSKLFNNPVPLPTLLSIPISPLPFSFWSRGVVPRVGRTESCTVTGSRRQSRTSTKSLDQWDREGTFIQLDIRILLQLEEPQEPPSIEAERD